MVTPLKGNPYLLTYVALHEGTRCTGCMVFTERAETAAVSCGTSHASAVSIHYFGRYSKQRYKKLVTHVESHASAMNLLESGE